MAGLTKTQLETKLTEHLTAWAAVLNGQTYSIAGRQVGRADARWIEEATYRLSSEIKRLGRGGIKITGATPV